jgi:hypothetical protein
MADAQALLPNKEGTNAAYFEALKSSQTDPKQQFWQRMLQGSLGVAAGTSPNAITNFAKGVEPAVSGYAEDVKSQQAAKQQMAKTNFDIANMDYTDRANLLKQAMDSQEKGDKIAADFGLKREEFIHLAEMQDKKDANAIATANINARASMANAGALQNLSREETKILAEASSPNATPEQKALGAALEKKIGLYHPTLSGQAAVDNAQTKAIKEKIDSLENSALNKSKPERAAIEEQIRTLRDLLPTGVPSTAGEPPKVEVAKDNDGKTYQKPSTMPQQAWEAYKTKFNLK